MKKKRKNTRMLD